jgi:hypothetical protein
MTRNIEQLPPDCCEGLHTRGDWLRHFPELSRATYADNDRLAPKERVLDRAIRPRSPAADTRYAREASFQVDSAEHAPP